MSTLRVSNIEAKADPSSPSVDEKLKVTNSNGDILVHIDGKTAGVTTIGINTTDRSFTVDAAQNVEFLGIVTATKFSLSGGGEITGGDGNFTGIVTSGSGNFTGGLTVGTAVTAATANFTSSLTAASANFTGNVSIAGTLTYEDVTNVDSVGIATARTGIDVTGGHIDLADNSKVRVGTGDDLQVYHDGTDTWIDNDEGDLYIRNTGDDIIIRAADDVLIQTQASEGAIIARGDGQVELYHNNSKKLETISSGAKITGVLEVTQEYPSIRPTLDLNFAATKTLDRRITFTRDGVGTYVGDDGLIKYASNNTPRFDHDPITHESLGLLIEEARINYAVYSSEFDNANHNKYDATVLGNQAVAPDGTTTADLLHPNSSGTGRGLEDVYNLPSTGIYTTSLYVKAAGLSWVQLYTVNGANRAFFNVSTGTKGSQTGGSGSFEDYGIIDAGNGWYRIYVTYNLTSTSGNEYYYVYFAGGDGNGTVTANGTDGVYVWGLQVEKGSFPTSYIPTSESTVTRGQDFAKITGTNFTDFYNQAEGTLVCDQSISDLTTANQYSVILSSNVNESIGMGYRVGGGASGGYGFYIIKSGDALFRNVTGVVSADTPIRTALAYKLNDGATVVNGESAVNDTSLVLPTPDRMLIGEGYSANNELKKGHIRKISYYNKRLTNGQMQGLTQQ